MAGIVGDIKPLNFDQKDMIVKLFDDLEVAHEKMACVCSRMSSLSKTLTPAQLMVMKKATIRLMIQLNTTAKFLDTPAESRRKIDLPKDVNERVKLTMTRDLEVVDLRKEQFNSATCLLAATFSYKLQKMFCGRITQKEIQTRYIVRPKQLALCISGR